MELIVRLHRLNRLKGKDYRITYVPDPICWTEAPESLKVLRSQRTRWQRGLAESLTLNWELLCHKKSGAVGWFAFPFFVLFELLGPVIEVVGYVLMTLGALLGFFSWEAFQIFMFVALSLGILLSVTALLMEEMSFSLFPRKRDVLKLFLAAIAENFGYRQLIALWRLQGLLRWLAGTKQRWGEMTRTGSLES
jgi:cellulose synthase/poly-beta-1,6-N-acetylglucosamine synthase-like glycosyltransferase